MVEGSALDVALHRLTMDPQADQQVMEGAVLAQHRAAVAIATQGLGREKAGGGHVGPVQGVMAIEGAAKTLGGVSDQFQAVLCRNRSDGRIVCGLAKQVDGNHGPGRQLALCLHRLDGGIQLDRIQIEGVGQNVDKDWRGPDQRHDLGRRRKSEGRAEHRIARANAPGHERQLQGLSSRPTGQDKRRLSKRPQGLFKGSDLRAHNIGTRPHNLQNGVL